MSLYQQEQLRHQYLDAIGLTSWLPRQSLPGAAPSADWVNGFRYPAPAEVAEPGGFDGEAPEAVGYTEVAPGTPASTATQTQAPGNARRSAVTGRAALAELAELAPDSARAAASAPTPAVASTSAQTQPSMRAETSADSVVPSTPRAPQPAPRFKLAFVVAGDLLLVESLPPRAPQGFAQPHQRLLAGLQRALQLPPATPEAELLAWPMLAGTTLNQGPDEALKAVRRKLNQTLARTAAQTPLRRALLLGSEAARWVLEREEELEALRGIRFTLSADLPCVCSYSLSQLLQLPELKAGLWKDLQPLLATR